MGEYRKFICINITDENFPEKLEESLLSEDLRFNQIDIAQTYHFRYFSNYLFYDKNGLKAKTIVIEPRYTCLTYLEDFINYFAHCYTDYNKQCKRVHFFSKKFNEEEFKEMVHTGYKKPYINFWDSYLGCIVVKPLSKGIIGVTYLKNYDGSERRNRHYTAIDKHPINLFGTTLDVVTMPYLEQDGVVGSCASSALWMAFQKTSDLFHSKKLSPSEITMLAGYDSNNTGKFFPSKGLEVSQICKAIYNNGLSSELRSELKSSSGNFTWIKGFVYGYLRMGIPLLFGIEIEQQDGYHLIALNGYRLKFSLEDSHSSSYVSEHISKFYAHDDQTGPFSRLKFLKQNDKSVLLTSWWKEDFKMQGTPANIIKKYFGNDENYYTCKPWCLIVPIDRKIKVTFEDIIDKVDVIKYLFKTFIRKEFVWDVYLIKSNDYKEEIKKEVQEKSRLDNLLYSSLPQYIWVAKAYADINSYKERVKEQGLLFDFIFDSIEMPFDGLPFSSNIYSNYFEELILNESIEPQVQNLFIDAKNASLYKDIIVNTVRFEEILQDEEKVSQVNDEEASTITAETIHLIEEGKLKDDENIRELLPQIISLLDKFNTLSKEIQESEEEIDSSSSKFDEEIRGFGENITTKYLEAL